MNRLKVIYHTLYYSMNNYVLIWGDWLSWSPITPYKETLVPHLVATLNYLSQTYSYHIRGDISPLIPCKTHWQKNLISHLWKCVRSGNWNGVSDVSDLMFLLANVGRMIMSLMSNTRWANDGELGQASQQRWRRSHCVARTWHFRIISELLSGMRITVPVLCNL